MKPLKNLNSIWYNTMNTIALPGLEEAKKALQEYDECFGIKIVKTDPNDVKMMFDKLNEASKKYDPQIIIIRGSFIPISN